MGPRRTRMKFQDEIEWIYRRRSTRIIALEEKKQKERERKLALALERKNNSVNQDIKNKGKGKTTMEVWDDLGDFNENEEGPSNKGHECKELNRLISSIKSIQELGRHSENASTSGTNESSLNGMPLKNILQIIIDFLQRKDPDELFAQPVDLDLVGNYYEIVKQPMDFGTMRAKLHEGMYTDLEHFKRDVFLICSNGMNANPATSKYHQVAENISRNAKRIFEALSADPEHPEIEFSQLRTPQKVSPKPAGRNSTTYATKSETEKRHMYWPPNRSLISEALQDNNPSILLNKIPNKYKESLLRFAEDMGPTAQRVTAKKLEALKDQQLCHGDTPTPQTPTNPVALDAQTLALALPFLNRPLTIPGSASQENRIANNTNAGRVNLRDGPSEGNKKFTNDNWHACAAALLSSFFFNNDKGASSSGIESSSNVFTRVYPTRVVSRPQPKPLESILSGHRNSTSGLSCMPQPRSVDTMPSINLPESSLVYQSRPENFMPCMPNNNLTELSIAHQPRPEDIINLSELSLVSQPRPRDSVYGMPSNNLTELSHVHHPWQADSMYILNPSSVSPLSQPNQGMSVSSTPYQPRDFQATLYSSNINPSTSTVQASHEQVLHQTAAFTPPTTQGFPDMQMQNHSSYFQLNQTDGWRRHL